MNPFVLYLFLAKATLTSFSGLASLPVLREDLVLTRHLLTDEQLNMAIVVSRTTPGPVGVYVVSVGYLVGGVPGAIAGWAAMITPAFIVIPFMSYALRRTNHRRVRSATRAVVAASAALLFVSLVPLARESLTDTSTAAIALTCAVLTFWRINPAWMVAGAIVLGFLVVLATG